VPTKSNIARTEDRRTTAIYVRGVLPNGGLGLSDSVERSKTMPARTTNKVIRLAQIPEARKIAATSRPDKIPKTT
jgi:hypothetical protein